MKGLYEVYTEKAHDELLGHIWLDSADLKRMREYGRLQLLAEDGAAMIGGPVPPMPYANMTLNTITLWMGYSSDRSSRDKHVMRIYTEATKEQVETARKNQENYFRYPVPISLFPG